MENDRTDDDTYLKLDDGTKYPYSGANHIVYDLDSNTDEHPELGEDYDLYLDPNGYVLGFKLGRQSPRPSTCTFRTPTRSCATGSPVLTWPTAPAPRWS